MSHLAETVKGVVDTAKDIIKGEAPTVLEKMASGITAHGPDATRVPKCPVMGPLGPNLMTTSVGQPLPDMRTSLNIGGYVLASDVHLMEKQQTFNRSKICERMVHACGTGAFGYFEVTQDVSRYTKAKFLDTVGKKTPVFVRFSTVTYGREFPDSARNPRGFAIKFYTEEGNYDLVGLNFPVFFVRDPAMGPDVIRSQTRDAENFLLNFDALFDFLINVPESLHCATMFFSNRGTPYGFRHMEGYGCHTFKWVNEAGEEYYIKYHFLPEAGVRNFTNAEATAMCGLDPDFAKRDLWQHINKGGEAVWKAYIQIMTPEQAKTCPYDPFDVTKVWSHDDFPLYEYGRLVLNRNVDNYHRDVEQAAFSPGSLVPGIEPSPDPLLQFRCFFYRDTQYYRLGVNLHQIPVNCPFAAKANHPQSRDGLMRTDYNGEGEPTIYPNSRGGPKGDTKYNWKPVPVSGVIDRASCSRHAGNDSEYDQARELFTKIMSDAERTHLFNNIAEFLKFAKPDIQEKTIAAFGKVHAAYAEGIRTALAAATIPPAPAGHADI
jgi:catalase